MSLFKTRTFWKTHCENVENFDQNSLIVVKLNTTYDCVITGSQTGILRIYQPEFGEIEYKATHLLIEKSLTNPILQIKTGRLVSGSPKVQLAVLQPKLLSIYTFATKEGETEHGMQNSLLLNYEHKLKQLAANFVLGPFGGCQNRDFACVQSLDGILMFFEQESYAFSCYLPDFLLPGPIAFLKASDSFIFCGCDWSITSLKYKLLSESGQKDSINGGDYDARKITSSDWKYNLGECVIDIEVIDDCNLRDDCIMILGERNFFCINDAGKLLYMKKIEFLPVCFANYVLDDQTISIIVAETRSVLIYQNTSLKWSAQLEILPIAIQRAFLSTIDGAIVLLTDDGQLSCCYLGTEPSLFAAPPISAQQVDFNKVGLELASLQKIIKTNHNNDTKVTNALAERELAVTVTTSQELEFCTFESKLKSTKMCQVSILLHPKSQYEEVQVAISVSKPLKAQPTSYFLTNCNEPITLKSYIFINETGPISSLKIEVVTSFITNQGVPRCVSKEVMLPLELALEPCPALKDGNCKVTLSINQAPVALNVLFADLVNLNPLAFTASGNALGFRPLIPDNVDEDNKAVVSVLLAKSSERYRLQADSISSLALVIEQMIDRLRKFHINTNNFAINFNSPLPTNDCLKCINQHFDARQKHSLLQEELSQLGVQFRLIQKRLISKIKVKNPTPLTNLQLLLDDTFHAIIAVGEKLQIAKENLSHSQNELACALHAVTDLIKLMDYNSNALVLIASTFSANVDDLDGQAWEDVMDASLCYLLRTLLAKSDKDKLRAAHTSFDEVKDVAKLEKHLALVLDRIPKGVLVETDPNNDEGETGAKMVEEEEEKLDEEKDPIGTKIGVASLRLLSARRDLQTRQAKINN